MSTTMDSSGGKYDYTVLCRNCDTESPEPIPCQVTGTIPEWLSGQLLYTGPGLTKVGQEEFRHAFDASALLQNFTVSNGKVTYKNRYVRSKTFEMNQAAGTITRAEFGTPAPASKGMFSRFLDAVDPEKMFSDNPVVSVVNIADRHYAMCETPFMHQVNPNTLETEDRININKKHGLMTQSPYPVVWNDGVYTVGQGVGVTGPKYNILRYPSDGNLKQGKVLASVPARWRLSPAYINSLSVTDNFVILIEQPLAVSLSELLSDIVNNAPFIEGLKWHNEPVLIHLIDRKTWKCVKTRYITDPFFYMHVANAYEEDDHIIMDIPTYKDSSILHNMFISTLREQRGKNTTDFVDCFKSTIHRFVIPVNTKGKDKLITLSGTSCTASWSGREETADTRQDSIEEILLQKEKLTDLPIENPCINPSKKGKKHQFIWGMGPNPDGGESGMVIKVDVTSGQTWSFCEDKLYSAGPIFIAKPDAVNEDDGIIMVQCLTTNNEKQAYLIVLDATDMTEIFRASAITPSPVTMPLHGLFIPAESQ